MTFRMEKIGTATLYCGDCREIVPTLPPVDALVTDPPYGVKERTQRASAGRSKTKDGYFIHARDWPSVIGDDEPFDPKPWLAIAPQAILWGGNHYASRLPNASKWLVWDKRQETAPDDNADVELAWTNIGGVARMHRQLWRGICRRGEENIASAGPRVHPTQKPVALMEWCLGFVPTARLILDPFMGSGTTGVACLRRECAFIGIEIDPTYFETACRRLDTELRQPRLFTEPVQKTMQEAML